MKTQLAKWGNSVAVRIPKAVADAARLRPGDQLEMAVEGPGTVRIKKKRKENLRILLDRITPENLHSATDWGGPTGKELW